MRRRRSSIGVPIAAAFLVCGCAPRVSGIVQDAASGRAIAGAAVELGNTGWGVRDGQVVWDAENNARTTTDADGRFQFDESGGVRLRVAAPGHAEVVASLCPRSPMTVRVGGPYPELRADRRLLFGGNGQAADQSGGGSTQASTGDDLGLGVSGTAFTGGSGLRMEARGGIRLVRGTGTVPAPPPLPYDRVVDLDLNSDCGWLFVSDGAAPVAVIQVGPLGWEEDPGQPRRWVMLYTPLPADRLASSRIR